MQFEREEVVVDCISLGLKSIACPIPIRLKKKTITLFETPIYG